VTEAGDGDYGRIKSTAGIGTLLAEGLGDTIRVSLTEAPEKEIPVCYSILQSLGLDIGVYTDEGKEVDLMQDINPRRNTPSRPTYESLGTSEYEED